MARGSFKHEDAQQGGFGFQEGNLLITKSVIAVHQFPPNAKTNEQSDPFVAMRWTGKKLDSEWNEFAGDDDQSVVIPIRLGTISEMSPGHLEPKDYDNLAVEPKDLGNDVDTEGNALLTEGAKTGRGWAIMEESLRKCGFKPEISGRGVASDFEGMVAHFKTIEGQKYIAKQGAKKGQEVTPTNLVCDRIHTFPYDKKKAVAKSAAANTVTGKTNGAADGDTVRAAVGVFQKLSPEFRKDAPIGKDVARADFQKALTKELMRQKLNPRVQKAIMDMAKDDDGLMALAMESGVFMTDGAIVTFV